jgi:hypothetical protein
LVLVQYKSDVQAVEQSLQEAYNKAGRAVKVWAFDANPKKEENYAMLQRIREGPNPGDGVQAPGGTGSEPVAHQLPQVIVTTMKHCVGVSFWKQCFVLMMQQPATLHQFLQCLGRGWREGANEHSRCHVTTAWPNDPTNIALVKTKEQLWEKLSGQYIFDGK